MSLSLAPVHAWLEANHAALAADLAQLVKIPSISTDGEHQKEIEASAALTCDQMRRAGLQNVEILRTGDSNPYAYGEWLGAPGKPTVFLYAHHDVQPINYVEDWKSPPWELTQRDGRLFGRGAADDKGAITTQLSAVAAFLKTHGSLPVNVKMLVEGEEEIGSSNLLQFFKEHKDRIHSDVIVVCDTENIEVGLPCITYALRGIVALQLEVTSASMPVHSGMAGGALADAALALNVLLARLFWTTGRCRYRVTTTRCGRSPKLNDAPRRHFPVTRPSGALISAWFRAFASRTSAARRFTNKPGANRPSRSSPRRPVRSKAPRTRCFRRRRPSSAVASCPIKIRTRLTPNWKPC